MSWYSKSFNFQSQIEWSDTENLLLKITKAVAQCYCKSRAQLMLMRNYHKHVLLTFLVLIKMVCNLALNLAVILRIFSFVYNNLEPKITHLCRNVTAFVLKSLLKSMWIIEPLDLIHRMSQKKIQNKPFQGYTQRNLFILCRRQKN